jgi:pyruvate dehydrogenase E2 component (dihydrolipoamide acetyltransferase)
MPSLSPTMTQGTIAKWIAKPGDQLNPGDVLCEIETDKAAVAFEMQESSILAKILVDAQSQEVAVGQPIALTVEDAEAYQAFLKLDPKDYPLTASAPASTPAAAPSAPSTPAPSSASSAATSVSTKDLLLSPAARNLVQREQLDVSKVQGSGKRGMISKSDVITARNAGLVSAAKSTTSATTSTPAPAVAPTPAAAAPTTTTTNTAAVNTRYVDIPNSNMRKVIAKRLTESKATVPHLYLSIECPADAVLKLRSQLKKDFDVNVSVNDIVIKAAALALRDVPEANAKWSVQADSVETSPSVDISIAVATPNGLITPILTHADTRSLVGINNTVKELATRARAGKLKPEEYQGGSFSISNLGMYGINSFSAVINPPQACILAVGSGVQKVVPPKTADGEPVVSTVVTVQLSADRRVVDEAIASQFLQVFRAYFSNPTAMLL